MGNRSMFVGLDVHKETIDVSIAEGHRNGEVRHYGVIASDLEPLDKVVRALRAPDRQLHFVYEAGPCGFGIYRHLTKRGERCVVVSPSMVPKRSGDRIKTDRRDSGMLARLHRAGELRAIHIPDALDEAMRDLVRAREDGVVVATQAKYRLKAFLLRQGRRYPGRAGWTIPYRRSLRQPAFASTVTSSFTTSDDDVEAFVLPSRTVPPLRDDRYSSNQWALDDCPPSLQSTSCGRRVAQHRVRRTCARFSSGKDPPTSWAVTCAGGVWLEVLYVPRLISPKELMSGLRPSDSAALGRHRQALARVVR